MKFSILSSILAAAISISSLAAFADDIPVVSASVATKDLPPLAPVGSGRLDPTSVAQAVGKPESPKLKINEDSIIKMIPGETQIVPIAINHPNRIVTPFEHPTLLHKDTISPEISGNVFYLTVTDNNPITIYIRDGDSEENVLSITFLPKRIPPRDIQLLADESVRPRLANKKAEVWEKSQPYVATLQTILKDVALGLVPSGYAVLSKPPANVLLPTCRPNGLRVEFGHQTLMGHNLIVHVGIATNLSTTNVEFDEDSCADWDVAAVAAFPKLVVKPGEKTEIYVIQKVLKAESSKKPRSSLLSVESAE